jgi:hypothetical protein
VDMSRGSSGETGRDIIQSYVAGGQGDEPNPYQSALDFTGITDDNTQQPNYHHYQANPQHVYDQSNYPRQPHDQPVPIDPFILPSHDANATMQSEGSAPQAFMPDRQPAQPQSLSTSAIQPLQTSLHPELPFSCNQCSEKYACDASLK